VVLMSGPYLHSAVDLALAPVLLNLEQNLARLRDSQDLEYSLALELGDDNAFYHTAAERVRRVEAAATRNVDLHGWLVRVTPDMYGLVVEHGDYKVTLMFGKQLTEYLQRGMAVSPSAGARADGPSVLRNLVTDQRVRTSPRARSGRRCW
jgi:hypothetical protein